MQSNVYPVTKFVLQKYMQVADSMKAAVETYKGIEFVRISTLPEDQKTMIWSSAYKDKVIKILRDKELLNDCLPYDHYLEWYKEIYKLTPAARAKEPKMAFR